MKSCRSATAAAAAKPDFAVLIASVPIYVFHFAGGLNAGHLLIRFRLPRHGLLKQAIYQSPIAS
jgi:hypothetical protein